MKEKLIFTRRKKRPVNAYTARPVKLNADDYEIVRQIASDTGLTKVEVLHEFISFAVQHMEIKEEEIA